MAHDVPSLYPPSAGRKGKDNVHVLERRNIRPGEKGSVTVPPSLLRQFLSRIRKLRAPSLAKKSLGFSLCETVFL